MKILNNLNKKAILVAFSWIMEIKRLGIECLNSSAFSEEIFLSN